MIIAKVIIKMNTKEEMTNEQREGDFLTKEAFKPSYTRQDLIRAPRALESKKNL